MALCITLGELIHQLAVKYEDRPAITMAVSGETLSYREFDTLINRIGHGLLSLSEIKSTYVGIMHENDLNYLAMTYALKKINKIEVSINRAFKGHSLSRMINLTECDIMMTSTSHFGALDQIKSDLPHLRMLIVTSGVEEARAKFPQWTILPFEEILSDETSHITSNAKDTESATIMFTSGTTGVSKGCLLSHRYAVRTAENIITPFRLTCGDVNYTTYPLSHISAYYDILPSLMVGGRVVMRDHFSLSKFWDEVIRHGASWFMCLGSVQQLLYSAPPSSKDRAHKITKCWSTPAPVPKADFDARFGLHLIPGGGYGSTDAGWVVTPQWNHPGGVVLPHYEIAIVDENNNFVPAGVKGEMIIRSKEPGVMADGYFGMSYKNLSSQQNDWLHTGDIGWLDNEGLFYFTCRMAERIRVKGEMISIFEVEEGALSHLEIEDAAAIGIPSEMGEEDIRLFVILKPSSSLTKDMIRTHCQTVMARFMVPKIITILKDMPRTPTGKIEKGKLAKIAVNN